MTKKILSIGYEFPGGDVEQLGAHSNRTLDDADIIVFSPTFQEIRSTPCEEISDQTLTIPEEERASIRSRMDHWREELRNAVSKGKILIVYALQPERIDAYVEQFNSYAMLPFHIQAKSISGNTIKKCTQSSYLDSYWDEFGKESKFIVCLSMWPETIKQTLLKTRDDSYTLGVLVNLNPQPAIVLPPVIYERENFIEYDEELREEAWNQDGKVFGKRLVKAILNLADAISSEANLSHPPEWSKDIKYRFDQEYHLEEQIKKKQAEITNAEGDLQRLEEEHSHVGELRQLLYETGKPLEKIIIQVLLLFGFDADGFEEEDSEFDAVFTSEEGRFLGEVEGKDRSVVNVKKMDQLERNIREDFERDGVEDFANGVLFGNSFRLKEPSEREEDFSQKCFQSAARTNTALVRTPDLFEPARYLKSKYDPIYAKSCREAILNTNGAIVEFPPVPGKEDSAEE